MSHYNKNLSRQTLFSSISLIFILSLSACQPTNNDSNATDAQTNNQTNGADASTAITPALIATQTEFPQYIKGMPALLHPITLISTEDGDGALSSIDYRKSDNYQSVFEKQGTYNYQTYASNFIFEEIATGNTQNLLPNDDFIIDQIFIPFTTQLKLIATDSSVEQADITDSIEDDADYSLDVEADRATAQVAINTPFDNLIYHISETPNQSEDKSKNIKRQQALYMSDHLGRQLIKLHPDNEYVQSTKWMPQVARYYFITRSDSDGNGLINDKDQTHNYQIDFTTDRPMVEAYDFAQ